MTLQSGSQILTSESPKVLVKTQIAGSHPQNFWFTGSEKGGEICISIKCPSDADASGLAIPLWDPLIQVKRLV